MWIAASLGLRGPGLFLWFCKAYLTFDNKFKVRCLVEVTLDYFSSLIWSSRRSLPPVSSRSLLLSPLRVRPDQRQTPGFFFFFWRKIKQINSDALDNIPLWLTRPRDLWDTLAGVVTSVCWFGLRVPTCRKTHGGEEEACPTSGHVNASKHRTEQLHTCRLIFRFVCFTRNTSDEDAHYLTYLADSDILQPDLVDDADDIYFHLIGENLYWLIPNTDNECFLQNDRH